MIWNWIGRLMGWTSEVEQCSPDPKVDYVKPTMSREELAQQVTQSVMKRTYAGELVWNSHSRLRVSYSCNPYYLNLSLSSDAWELTVYPDADFSIDAVVLCSGTPELKALVEFIEADYRKRVKEKRVSALEAFARKERII